MDLPKGIAVNIFGQWSDSFETGSSFDYVSQRYAAVGEDNPNDYRYSQLNNNRIVLNAKISKKIMDGKMSVYLWGNDLLEDGTIIRSGQFTQYMPRQKQRMFGAGVIANF